MPFGIYRQSPLASMELNGKSYEIVAVVVMVW